MHGAVTRWYLRNWKPFCVNFVSIYFISNSLFNLTSKGIETSIFFRISRKTCYKVSRTRPLAIIKINFYTFGTFNAFGITERLLKSYRFFKHMFCKIPFVWPFQRASYQTVGICISSIKFEDNVLLYSSQTAPHSDIL